MSDERFAWLRDVCSTEERRVGQLDTPWTIQRADGPWTIASDGHALAAIPGDHGFPPPGERTPKFENVMALPDAPRHVLPLVELRAMAAPWIGTVLEPCDKCKNSGQIECEECDGRGGDTCTCECGDTHDVDCDACDGRGWVGCDACPRGVKHADDFRPVRIGDGVFDLRVLAKLLPFVEAEAALFCQAATDRSGFFLVGDWILAAMPVRQKEHDGTRDWSDAPTIAFAEPSTLASGEPVSQ